MKRMITMNIVIAAISGGAIASILQPSQSPIYVENTTIPQIEPGINSNYSERLQTETTLSTFRAELSQLTNKFNHLNAEYIEQKKVQHDLLSSLDSLQKSNHTPQEKNLDDHPHSEPDVIELQNSEPQASRISSLNNLMELQQSDSIRETEAHSSISNNIQGLNLEDSALQSLECQGVICRIEMAHFSKTAADIFIEKSVDIVPWNHKGAYELVETESGDLTSVYFITQTGAEID